ncbi:hypothetical protein V8E54_014844 [Elaphomyces granulatus]
MAASLMDLSANRTLERTPGGGNENSARMDDPFVSSPLGSGTAHESHRLKSFDTQLFTLDASSPSQAKRALEAHLAETERRLQEASKLGKALVEQQQVLIDRLKEVEREGEIGPELHRKLIELEKEYNEIGRESARAFLAPKRLISAEDSIGSIDVRSPSTPSTLFSHATGSPSKVGVPSRRQRNQPSSRVHDIEFVTDISTSLLAQVRQLQVLLAERDEALKAAEIEKAKLEVEAESCTQRIRAFDENEQHYKDENWSLETQLHDLMAVSKEAADREHRLNGSLSVVTAEKNGIEREIEELRQTHGKLVEDQAAAQKAYDTETHMLRRSLNNGDTERATLQAQVGELTAQNQELAKAVNALRSRFQESEPAGDLAADSAVNPPDQTTPESSPPPSPNKQTPRHGHLETETLRSSLGHAHRMIQNLKSNIHREKTEKIELKRMLQEARDELEQRRREPHQGPGSAVKRQKTKADSFKKPALRPDLLGPGRKGRTEITLDELDWEDHTSDTSPARPGRSRLSTSRSPRPSGEHSEAYQTATEADDAFETANETTNERETGTESEAFQTGAESMADDSNDELTETEGRTGLRGSTSRGRRVLSSLIQAKAGDRTSFFSTASTSADETEDDLQTPVQVHPPRYRLKMSRDAFRRIRPSGEAPMASSSTTSSVHDSPASFKHQEPTIPAGQSLLSELEELGSHGSEGEFGTPLRSHVPSHPSTPQLPTSEYRRFSEAVIPPIPKVVMVDSSTMTESLQDPDFEQAPVPEPETSVDQVTGMAGKSLFVSVDSSTQYTPTSSPRRGKEQFATFPTPTSLSWDDSAISITSPLAEETPATISLRSAQLDISSILFEETVPVAPPVVSLERSSILTTMTEPVTPTLPELDAVLVAALDSEAPREMLPQLSVSPIYMEQTTPMLPQKSPAPADPIVQLSISTIQSEETTPIEPIRISPPPVVPVSASDDSPKRPKTAVRRGDDSTPQSAWKSPSLFVAEDHASRDTETERLSSENRTALPLDGSSGSIDSQKSNQMAPVQRTDQAAQTVLSSKQIDQMLMDRAAVREITTLRPSEDSRPGSPSTTPRPKAQSYIQPAIPSLQPTPRRPGSASSQRWSPATLPPLPSDHKQIIAAAQNYPSVSGSMGPPLAPASAYRTGVRPRTPNEHISQTSANVRDANTIRAMGRPRSQLSRRSSLSSFASELDERFNIRPDGTLDMRPRTDPRMIQAITQTMIGEYLWKYTRKTVSGDISNTRHRRYFWVHPYTRTLYWSDQDPQSAGKAELRAKSVPIEAIRVITDDNPYPPGLHRKSLEIVTPARRIRFTASTSQRHETWFNALSYLLLRTSSEESEDHDHLTADDVDEFNPSFLNSSRPANARVSLSSVNSRTSRNTSKTRATSAMSIRPAVTPGRASPAPSARPNSTLRASDPGRHSSASRLSSVITATIRGSFSSRRGRHSHTDESIYDAVVEGHDSAEDLRQAIERQEREADRLENVRACCDGKHDVSSLPRTSRYSPGVSRLSYSHN